MFVEPALGQKQEGRITRQVAQRDTQRRNRNKRGEGVSERQAHIAAASQHRADQRDTARAKAVNEEAG
ncbi:hypothetical protein D3C85_1614720 [compost metagenome]